MDRFILTTLRFFFFLHLAAFVQRKKVQPFFGEREIARLIDVVQTNKKGRERERKRETFIIVSYNFGLSYSTTL